MIFGLNPLRFGRKVDKGSINTKFRVLGAYSQFWNPLFHLALTFLSHLRRFIVGRLSENTIGGSHIAKETCMYFWGGVMRALGARCGVAGKMGRRALDERGKRRAVCAQSRERASAPWW